MFEVFDEAKQFFGGRSHRYTLLQAEFGLKPSPWLNMY
jgi:hypothetical protein